MIVTKFEERKLQPFKVGGIIFTKKIQLNNA